MGSTEFEFEHRLVRYYLKAKRNVLSSGFGHEIVWQASRREATIDEKEFLTQAAWVILSAGLSERVVASRFEAISSAFLHFSSATVIVANRTQCCDAALKVFNHRGKVGAIAFAAQMIVSSGYEALLKAARHDPMGVLRQIPYIGVVTAQHLAKNIGIPTAKPDRHLVRIAEKLGISVDSLCHRIASSVGDAVEVVDLVLWRNALLERSKVGVTHALSP